ncbi:hypothetical protein ABW636_07210 [Aquimarina sp. 2201CG1-2-11]|uniref:hypothetical protein n=1 Tax=Aquimarina discodermiae TaxID=3231043 RepID=UPI003462CB36
MHKKKFNVTELEERLEFCNCPAGYTVVTKHVAGRFEPIQYCKAPANWNGADIVDCL